MLDEIIENTKTELHTHFMGMLSADEFIKLLADYSSTIYWPMNTSKDDYRQIINISILFENEKAYKDAVNSISIPYGGKRDYENGLKELYRNRSELLAHVIKEFANKKGITENEARLYIYNDYFNRSMRELVKNGVTYTEISFANEEIIDALVVDEDLKSEISYTFLLCTQRTNSVGPTMQEKIRRAYDSGNAIGFDFMGMETPIDPGELEKTGSRSYYGKLDAVLEVLIERRSSVLRFHSGESKGTEDNTEKIFRIIDKIKAKKGYHDFPPPELRIGHAIHYSKTDYYYDFMKKNHVIVEINASSNLALSNVDSLDELPYVDYLDHGIPIAISTDGHGVYSTTTIIEDRIAYYNYLKGDRKDAYYEHIIQESELIERKVDIVTGNPSDFPPPKTEIATDKPSDVNPLIENFRESLISYEEEYRNFTESEIMSAESQSITNYNPRTILINERIKVSASFTYYIIERCKTSDITHLRKLVEEYEKHVAIIKDNDLSCEDYFDIRNMTVVLDVLFGIDVTYSSNLYTLIQEGKMEKILDYLERNMSYDLSYEDLMSVIKEYCKEL